MTLTNKALPIKKKYYYERRPAKNARNHFNMISLCFLHFLIKHNRDKCLGCFKLLRLSDQFSLWKWKFKTTEYTNNNLFPQERQLWNRRFSNALFKFAIGL